MSKYCSNCGNELRENAIFCDKCGSAITSETAENVIEETEQQKEKSNKKKWIVLLAVSGGIFIVILCIVVLMFTLPKGTVPTGNPSEEMSAAEENSNPNAVDNELTEEERLRNEYFTDLHLRNDILYGNRNIAEFLVRGQNIFNGAKLLINATVSSILPSENVNDFLVTVETSSSDNVSVKRIAIKGTYQPSDVRLVIGDNVTVIGNYAGVEMFEETDGSHIEYGVLDNCKIISNTEYSLENMKTIVASILGQEFEIEKSGSAYSFSRTLTEFNRNENWLFPFDPISLHFANYNENSYITVSFNGGTPSRVIFDTDYKHYLSINPNSVSDDFTIKYYEVNGTELWSKTIKTFKYAEFIESNLYLYADNEVYIINKIDGTEKVAPIYVPDKDRIHIINDSIILMMSKKPTDTIIALDKNGNVLWRFSLESNCSFNYNFAVINDELLIEYTVRIVFNELHRAAGYYDNPDMSYSRYKRLNLQTGEVISEFKIDDADSWQ